MVLAVPSHTVAPASPLPSQLALRWWWAAALVLTAAGIALHFSAFDTTVFYAANGWMTGPQSHSPAFEAVWSSFWSLTTVLGLGLSAAIVVPAIDRGRGDLTAALLVCFPIGTLFTHGGKWLVGSARPGAVLPHDTVHFIGHALMGQNSMPSGHSITAFAMFTVLVLMRPAWRRWAAALLVAAVLIAWSRLAVAAHWPGDVLAGSGLGITASLIACSVAAGSALQQRLARPAWQCGIACVELGAAIAMLTQHTGYPLGVPMQWLLAAVAVTSASLRLRRVLRLRGAGAAGATDAGRSTARS